VANQQGLGPLLRDRDRRVDLMSVVAESGEMYMPLQALELDVHSAFRLADLFLAIRCQRFVSPDLLHC
jgi:hypothetical protein